MKAPWGAQRRDRSILSATRAGVASAYCLAPWTIALLFENPIVLGGALVAELAAAQAAGAGRELRRALRFAIPLALMIALINPLVSSQGLTVVAQGLTLPVLGQIDVTLEAIVYGLVAGLRVLVTVLPFALFTACVDPDELLRSMRRVSLRSALTVSLATRLIPSLARDAERLGAAYGLRADVERSHGRWARTRKAAVLTRALGAGALERGVDTAAALEVRGYGAIRRPSRERRPWSRADLWFALTSAAFVATAILARIAGIGEFVPYPLIDIESGAPTVGFAALLPLVVLTPFVGARVARARRAVPPAGLEPSGA